MLINRRFSEKGESETYITEVLVTEIFLLTLIGY